MRDNIRLKLKTLGLNWPVYEKPGCLWIPVPGSAGASPAVPVSTDAGETPALPAQNNVDSVERCLASLKEVFGVAWFAITEPLPHRSFKGSSEQEDFTALENALVALATAEYAPGKAFCVRVKRSEKSVPFGSMELEKRFGTLLIERTPWKRVDLDNPDALFQVEIRGGASFVFSNKLKGPGGLPVRTAGRVLTLLSGGIDSPVAAYLMAKRGCSVDFLHFTATSMQQDEALQYKVYRLAKILSRYTLGSRLFLAPYTQFDVALVGSGQEVQFDLILFRRFMARVAERLAQEIRAEALVSGDNLAQVASQTLSNMVATSRALDMPIFRPLVGFNKEEIIQLAQHIGTYRDSIEPYKDCCAIISRRPRTRSYHDHLSALEKRIFPDYDKLIEATLAETIRLEIKLF